MLSFGLSLSLSLTHSHTRSLARSFLFFPPLVILLRGSARSVPLFPRSLVLSLPPPAPARHLRLVHSLSLSCAVRLVPSPSLSSSHHSSPSLSRTRHESSPSRSRALSPSFFPRLRAPRAPVRAPCPRAYRNCTTATVNSFAPAARPVLVYSSTDLSLSLGPSHRSSRQPNVGISRYGGIVGTHTRHALPRIRAEAMRAVFVNLSFPSSREKMER